MQRPRALIVVVALLGLVSRGLCAAPLWSPPVGVMACCGHDCPHHGSATPGACCKVRATPDDAATRARSEPPRADALVARSGGWPMELASTASDAFTGPVGSPDAVPIFLALRTLRL